MDSSVEVVEPATEFSLLSMRDARLGLNLTGVSENTEAQIELLIKWASDEIAKECNRVLAQEKVQETIWDLDDTGRIWLSRFPVKEIHSLNEAGVDLVKAGWNLDKNSGKLTRIANGFPIARGVLWGTPVVITYTGGYDLPKEAPKALAQAAMLMTREAYNQLQRGDTSIRMVSHKDSRVIYFDPNAHLGSGGGGGSSTKKAVLELVKKYVRFAV